MEKKVTISDASHATDMHAVPRTTRLLPSPGLLPRPTLILKPPYFLPSLTRNAVPSLAFNTKSSGLRPKSTPRPPSDMACSIRSASADLDEGGRREEAKRDGGAASEGAAGVGAGAGSGSGAGAGGAGAGAGEEAAARDCLAASMRSCSLESFLPPSSAGGAGVGSAPAVGGRWDTVDRAARLAAIFAPSLEALGGVGSEGEREREAREAVGGAGAGVVVVVSSPGGEAKGMNVRFSLVRRRAREARGDEREAPSPSSPRRTRFPPTPSNPQRST